MFPVEQVTDYLLDLYNHTKANTLIHRNHTQDGAEHPLPLKFTRTGPKCSAGLDDFAPSEEQAATLLMGGRCTHKPGVPCRLVTCDGVRGQHLFCVEGKSKSTFLPTFCQCCSCRDEVVSTCLMWLGGSVRDLALSLYFSY